MRRFDAVIFDLDGVLTDTAESHYEAWLRLAEEIGIPFNRKINERLKGVSRQQSLEIILERADRPYSDAEKLKLTDRKNGYYREIIAHIAPKDLLPGAFEALKACRAAGLATALASASHNAPALVKALDIGGLLDYIANPAKVAFSKPAPDIFLAAAKGVKAAPARCLGVEDAAAGVQAIKAAGMMALGVGDAVALSGADLIIPDMTRFDLDAYLAL